MQTFLGKAARRVYESHTLNELQHLEIILPSRRAALYFKNELALLSAVPFFSPAIRSIDDFIQESSGLKPVDVIDLYFEIFEIWKTQDPNQSFEKFLTWVPTLLKDFNLIDSSLLENPHLLFKYMSEAEALSRWDLESEEHVFSDNSVNYFSFFDKMSATYEILKNRLLEKGFSYTGLAYRYVADRADELNSPEVHHYYFVGLNALSRAEEKIVESLVKSRKATCLWDSDSFYMNTSDKAGRKLRNYKRSGKYGGEWTFQENDLLSTEKHFKVFELNSKVLQTKVAVELAASSNSSSHALVMLDESDFTSLFVQLPALDLRFNVSAGVAFKASKLASVLDVYIRFLEYPGDSIPIGLVRNVLSDPLISEVIRSQAGEEGFTRFQQQIFKTTHLYQQRPRLAEDLKGSKVFGSLMRLREQNSFLQALDDFLKVLMSLETGEMPFVLLLEEKLTLLRSRLAKTPGMSVDAFRIVLRELIKNLSVPFEKESGAKLQIMSMLETRCLDFEEVTLLSFLEGNLPSGKKNNSFIPYDATRHFDLPLYSDQDAIMAYHFYRLLQRADKVNFIYLKDSGTGVGRKEPSRFLRQIQQELLPANPRIGVKYPEITFSETVQTPIPAAIQIQKTSGIVEKMVHFLENKGLSPTSVNEYFKGDLGFYWRYIERIKSKEQDSADIGNNVFGSLVHYILEMTDMPYVKGNALITKEILLNQKNHALTHFDQYVKENQPDFDFDYGLNAVLKTLAKELIGKYYDKRIREFREPFYIVGIEQEFAAFVEVKGVRVKIIGKIDKIEQYGNTRVIIDYKTGDVKPEDIRFIEKDEQTLSAFLVNPDKEKFRQLLIYYFLVNEQPDVQFQYEFKFYSFRRLGEDLVLQVVDHTREQILDAVRDMLADLATNLLDTDKPFAQDPELKVNQYSDFYELLV